MLKDQWRAIKQSTPEIRNWVLTCPYSWANIVTINSLHLIPWFPIQASCSFLLSSHWTLRPCPSAWTVPPAAAAPWPLVPVGAALRQPTAGVLSHVKHICTGCFMQGFLPHPHSKEFKLLYMVIAKLQDAVCRSGEIILWVSVWWVLDQRLIVCWASCLKYPSAPSTLLSLQ